MPIYFILPLETIEHYLEKYFSSSHESQKTSKKINIRIKTKRNFFKSIATSSLYKTHSQTIIDSN